MVLHTGDARQVARVIMMTRVATTVSSLLLVVLASSVGRAELRKESSNLRWRWRRMQQRAARFEPALADFPEGSSHPSDVV